MDVSVVIVNWNTEKLLMDCLKTMHQYTEGIEFEVIVVDNASRDGSVNMIRNSFPQVLLIENKSNLGYAAANNIGIKAAKGEYILVLNSDIIFIENSIAAIYNIAKKRPDIAVSACKILNADKTIQRSVGMFPSLLNFILFMLYLDRLFSRNRFFGRERMTWWDCDCDSEVDILVGCFLFVKKEAIEQVGAMDADFFMYYEEIDWCYRFKKNNWKIFYTPASSIIHLGGESTIQNKGPMLMQHYSSMLLFYKKHYGRMNYALSCFLLSLFFFIRIPYWLAALAVKRQKNHALTMLRLYSGAMFNSLRGWRGLLIKQTQKD